MKKVKSLISLLLFCSTLLSSFCFSIQNYSITAFAESDTFNIDGVVYRYDSENKNWVIKYVTSNASGDLIIQEEISDQPVTGADYNAFLLCNNVTSISIPKYFCDSINFSQNRFLSLEKFIVDEDNSAFSTDTNGALYNKQKTELLCLPPKCNTEVFNISSSVNDVAFSGPVSVKAFSVDENNPNFSSDENGVLYDKAQTILIKYPSSSSLKEFVIPGTVTEIMTDAFSSAINLEKVFVPSSVSSASYIFANCTALKHVETSSKNPCFYGCNRPSKITFEDGKTIVEWAENNSATNLHLSKSITDTEFFYFLHGLTNDFGEITLEKGNEHFTVKDGVLFDKNVTKLILFPGGIGKETYALPDSVTEICTDYFVPFSNVKELTLGKGFKSTTAFSLNGNDTIEESVNTYGNWLGNYHYYDNLIGFIFNPSSIESINVHKDNPYFSSENGILYSKDKKVLVRYPYGRNTKELTIKSDTIPCPNSFAGEFERIIFDSGFSEILYNAVKEYLIKGEGMSTTEKEEKYFAEILSTLLSFSSVKEFCVSEDDPYLSTVDGALYAFSKKWLIKYPIACKKNFYSIPESVEHLSIASFNDIVTTPFCSVTMSSTSTDNLDIFYTTDQLTVHINEHLVTQFNPLKTMGIGKLCFGENDNSISEINQSASAYSEMFCGDPVAVFMEQLSDGFSSSMKEATIKAIIEQQKSASTLVELCSGNHKLSALSDNENVLAEYTTDCFGDGDAFVKISVEESEGERANEMASLIIQNKANATPEKIYNIVPRDADGNAVQPQNGNKVTVKLRIPENCSINDNFIIFHWVSDTNKLLSYSGSKLKTETVNGFNYLVFEVEHFSEFAVCVLKPIESVPSVSIKNKSDSTTINYGDILRLTAVTENLPDDARIYWYVNDIKQGEGESFDFTGNASAKITVKIVDANGNDYAEKEISDSQSVTVKAGFFQKLISFFKNLFGLNRIIEQSF